MMKRKRRRTLSRATLWYDRCLGLDVEFLVPLARHLFDCRGLAGSGEMVDGNPCKIIHTGEIEIGHR